MMTIPRFARQYDGYQTADFKEYVAEGRIEIHLIRREDKPWSCSRCGNPLSAERGRYRLRLETLPVLGLRCFVYLWRHKGDCRHCRKARAEVVPFVAKETPHLTDEYAFWIGRLCEIAAVSRVAELTGQDEMTTWRVDLRRMKRMLAHYRIPEVTAISVDEVYARKKARHPQESRDERFFTVISDLNTRRVIWVSESRRKEALDQFFLLIGEDAAKKITVAAIDQHEGYAASIRQHCPAATLVWDRFHVMQIFEEAVNETRKQLHQEQPGNSEMRRLTRGQYRFLFLKKAARRTPTEQQHITDVLKANEHFVKLELIKERMITFFDQPGENAARQVWEEVGEWIWQAGFEPLMRWYRNLDGGWHTLKNYFTFRVTSALSEGHNNVIKALKRRAYGYRNMEYFRLKIMQVCGYLNSRYVTSSNQLLAQK